MQGQVQPPVGGLEHVFAERLRAVAKARGIPLSHLADRAEMARSYLWRILASKSSPTLATVQRLAQILDVAPLDLLVAKPTLETTAPGERAAAGKAART